MNKAINWKFTMVLLLIGFMIAIQYNSVKNPKIRDTRDIWAIRQELAEEKKLHSELLSEIRDLDKTISTYKSLSESSAGQALNDTVDKLNRKAGTTDITGPGITIEINPSPESVAYGIPITSISSDLLTRFVNEVNRFKGITMEIDGKRYTVMSSIRVINGYTSVNGLNVSTPPFKIKIISPTMSDSEKLYNYLLASSIHDDFYLDNLVLDINQPVNDVSIRGWPEKFENLYLQELPKGE
ncbi:DUF881 domain-containing protein [Sporosarcina thermotolerans]|uniref:DUF881 domain-containing protein n=1 Tax=Sporosarcina thermotolerans TaxID=633404 RepID=A0AAW9A4T9_9BACL|nr:DUF881 domain-containing protein [Sporosarcina thermotolerans]MDW0115814.1 DUF881 domain-containing protein [Sporosarcina thermotolerans]